MSELFEQAWLNCLNEERFDIDDMFDLLEYITSGLNYDPYSFGEPHFDNDLNGWWVFSTPPIRRLPQVYILYGIDAKRKRVDLFAAHFP